jgi:hypothetical protein
MSDCIHTWVEGGNRDRGRYHCSLCFECLSVPGLLVRMTELEDALLTVDKVRSAALTRLAEAERVVALLKAYGDARQRFRMQTAGGTAYLDEAAQAVDIFADALAAGGE